MKNNLSARLNKDFTGNKKFYIPILLIFLTGILTGALYIATTGAFSQTESYLKYIISSDNLINYNSAEIFRLSLFSLLPLSVILWLSGRSVWFLPLGGIQIGLQGFSLGYTIAGLLDAFSWRGLLFAISALLPRNLILIPSIFIFSVYQIQFATDRRLIHKGVISAPVKRQIYTHNLIMLCLFIPTIILCSLTDAYISPVLIKFICTIFT